MLPKLERLSPDLDVFGFAQETLINVPFHDFYLAYKPSVVFFPPSETFEKYDINISELPEQSCSTSKSQNQSK